MKLACCFNGMTTSTSFAATATQDVSPWKQREFHLKYFSLQRTDSKKIAW